MLIYERTFIGVKIDIKHDLIEDDGRNYHIIECDDKILLNKLSDGEVEITRTSIVYNEECTYLVIIIYIISVVK